MPSVYDNLFEWARKKTSSVSGFPVPDACGDDLIYRLREWPHLPAKSKTVGVYRILSVMSSRPVNRHWIIGQSGLTGAEVDLLLRRLVADNAVDVIDASRFRAADTVV
ncbi:MAG: hypothetical protein ABI907_03415 [Ramlibacter sp.]